jgi:serine/threonine protein kinase
MSAVTPDTPTDRLPEGEGSKPRTERPTHTPGALDASGHDASAAGGLPTSVPAGLAHHHRYRILDLIETGGMGTVLRAQHLFLRRLVALKIINKSLVQNWKMRERFFTEMQAAAQLCHPNIVAVYDADVVGDTSFLVMELVDGVPLHKVVMHHGPLPIRQACEYVQQTAAGMQHALDCSIVHRDIKPNNLMLTPEGKVKILDFGLARYLTEMADDDSSFELPAGSTDFVIADAEEEEASNTPPLPRTVRISRRLTSRCMGTPDFVAPEMARDPIQADVRADIYSLGCTLYFLLTGQVPFPDGGTQDKMRAHSSKTPTPLRELRPEIPERLAAAVDRMMAKSPEDRYPTPADVIKALQPFTTSERGTVLVVDDDPFIRTTLTAGLESQGFTVQVAGDGLEALNVLQNGPPPQLILLDLLMPGMDGYQFLQERQRDPALTAIPVVVLSGIDPTIAGQITGAVDYLLKPIEADAIAKDIHRYFAKK